MRYACINTQHCSVLPDGRAADSLTSGNLTLTALTENFEQCPGGAAKTYSWLRRWALACTMWARKQDQGTACRCGWINVPFSVIGSGYRSVTCAAACAARVQASRPPESSLAATIAQAHGTRDLADYVSCSWCLDSAECSQRSNEYSTAPTVICSLTERLGRSRRLAYKSFEAGAKHQSLIYWNNAVLRGDELLQAFQP